MVGKGSGIPVRPQEPLESVRLKVLFHPLRSSHLKSVLPICATTPPSTHTGQNRIDVETT